MRDLQLLIWRICKIPKCNYGVPKCQFGTLDKQNTREKLITGG